MADSNICSIPGCVRNRHNFRGWCKRHYMRWVRYRDPLGGGPDRKYALAWLEQSFKSDTDDCILWPYGTTKDGYGTVRHNLKMRKTHRVVCEWANGPVPSNQHETAHSCGNAACVNKAHLRWATRLENTNDKRIHGTMPRGEATGRAKLTEAQVREIRKLIQSKGRREIAKIYGVHPATVDVIKKRQSWGWLE